MVCGLIGMTGATVLSRVVAVCRIDQELAPIPHPPSVAIHALGKVTKRDHAMKILVQVKFCSLYFLHLFIEGLLLLPVCWNSVSFQFVVAVDGSWAEWRDWSDCSVSCGGGVQNRSRPCTNPPPAFGGETCPGESDETRACNEDPCPSKVCS